MFPPEARPAIDVVATPSRCARRVHAMLGVHLFRGAWGATNAFRLNISGLSRTEMIDGPKATPKDLR